jgi:hypothetical protein
MFPRVHILGAPKSATSSLHAALTSSSDACGCSSSTALKITCAAGKELSLWWGYELSQKQQSLTATQYATLFEQPEGSSCSVSIDSTPCRFHQWFAPRMLKRLAEEAGLVAEMRLVVILREPVSRHLSFYNHRLVDREVDRGAGVSGPRYISFWQSPTSPERWGLCENDFGTLPTSLVPSHTMLAKCEVQRWQRAMCDAPEVDAVYSRGNNATSSDSCWLRQVRNADTSTWLAKSIYAPQLRLWAASGWRSQLLVVSFDKLMQEGPRRVLQFVGRPLPDSNGSSPEMPHTHSLPSRCRVERVQCSALRDLSAVYGPWNRALYALLQHHARMGLAPKMEEAFEPFSPPPCTEKYLPPFNVTWCSCGSLGGLRFSCGRGDGAGR